MGVKNVGLHNVYTTGPDSSLISNMENTFKWTLAQYLFWTFCLSSSLRANMNPQVLCIVRALLLVCVVKRKVGRKESQSLHRI